MKAKKKLGQNFQKDQRVIERIINNFRPKADDIIFEIGPGHAALTDHLVHYSNHLNLVEIDNDLVHLLQAKYAGKENVTLHHIDALTLKLETKNTYQERTIQELNVVVERKQLQINKVEVMCKHLMDRMQTLADTGGG